MNRRPRRNRQSSAMRDLVQETQLTVNDFIYPLFLLEGNNMKTEMLNTMMSRLSELSRSVQQDSPGSTSVESDDLEEPVPIFLPHGWFDKVCIIKF